MHDPRPAAILCTGFVLAGATLVGWWLTQPPPHRSTMLAHIARTERATTAPPASLLAQVRWLVWHRGRQLQGMGALGTLCVLIGLVEGWERRRRHPFGGLGLVRLAWGQIGAMILGGALVAFVILPWTLPLHGAALSLATLAGLSAYGVASGLPRVH